MERQVNIILVKRVKRMQSLYQTHIFLMRQNDCKGAVGN